MELKGDDKHAGWRWSLFGWSRLEDCPAACWSSMLPQRNLLQSCDWGLLNVSTATATGSHLHDGLVSALTPVDHRLQVVVTRRLSWRWGLN